MKNGIVVLLSLIALVVTSGFENSSEFEPVAVIELYTSQGCSSCPPADRLLSQVITEAKKDGKKIFALSFHVDYWNRLGWEDTFSDEKYTERQRAYASGMNLSSVYTPQMIVNGTSEFVGSKENELQDALRKSFNEKSVSAFKILSVTRKNENPIHVRYEIEGNFSGCKINFALVSLNETTSVKRGENNGHILKSESLA